jgi:hypothetical protein
MRNGVRYGVIHGNLAINKSKKTTVQTLPHREEQPVIILHNPAVLAIAQKPVNNCGHTRKLPLVYIQDGPRASVLKQ